MQLNQNWNAYDYDNDIHGEFHQSFDRILLQFNSYYTITRKENTSERA
jgi:hypothetical protein